MAEVPSEAARTDVDTTHTAATVLQLHPSVGPYCLLHRLGEGGMGEVWLAEQTTPVRRDVALKVIKAGMDTAQVTARFEAERQALALMDHPAIAKVFDGGSTLDGRPYFAMEYVKGEPITRYCDRNRLDTGERLALFILVCEGVQHAHQKGIIHRDIKPSNVLVTLQDDRPVPKIIDFGVAKATTQHLTERTLFTETGVLIGTPEYMSPEQAESSGIDIDTRTDVYALGVLLYELLTGALPFDRRLRDRGLDEIRRTIREVEPPRPSTRVTQLGPASTEAAKNRQTEPSRLASQLRGDLDWITMKALEKDRTRRYSTVSGLANDVRRHLLNEPVIAGPPSVWYRTGKFVRRHRFGAAAAALTLLLLVAFGITMAVQAQRIARERDRATREAQAAKEVTDFLVSLFKVSDPSEARGATITTREILDRGAARVRDDLAQQPELQSRLMAVMGTVYDSLGLSARARPFLERALQTRERVLGPDHPDTLDSRHAMGVFVFGQGKYAEAEQHFRRTLEGRRRVLGPEDPSTLKTQRNLASTLMYENKLPEAERVMRETLTATRKMEGHASMATAAVLNNLGNIVYRQGKWDEAERCWQEALDIARSTVGPDHPNALMFLHNIGHSAWGRGQLDVARRVFEEEVNRNRRVLGPDHPETLKSDAVLADLLREQGHVVEAAQRCTEVLDAQRRTLPDDHPDLVPTLTCAGSALIAQRRFAEALPLLQQAARLTAPDDWSAAEAKSRLGETLAGQRQFAAAEPWLLDGYSAMIASNGAPQRIKQQAYQRVVEFYGAWNKPEKVAEWRAKASAPAPPQY